MAYILFGSDKVAVTREIKDKYAHQVFETREVQIFTRKHLENSHSKNKRE